MKTQINLKKIHRKAHDGDRTIYLISFLICAY